LSSSTQVRYVPDGTGSESGASISYLAWDGSDSNTAGSRVDTTFNGGASAFSSATNTASVTVSIADDPLTLSLSQPAAVTYIENDQYLLDTGFILGRLWKTQAFRATMEP
jgi:hypothetical protein